MIDIELNTVCIDRNMVHIELNASQCSFSTCILSTVLIANHCQMIDIELNAVYIDRNVVRIELNASQCSFSTCILSTVVLITDHC